MRSARELSLIAILLGLGAPALAARPEAGLADPGTSRKRLERRVAGVWQAAAPWNGNGPRRAAAAWATEAARLRLEARELRQRAASSAGDRRGLLALERRLRSLGAPMARSEAASPAATATGSISGTVRDAVTLQPLSDVRVHLFFEEHYAYTFVVTDTAGRYTLGELAAGSYFVATENSKGYLDEAYDDVICGSTEGGFGCWAPTVGTAITVTAGAVTSGIDFALAKGGRVAGRVTDSATGAGLASAQVTLRREDGVVIETVVADGDGRYLTGRGLRAGSYRATAVAQGHFHQLYQNLPCPAGECDAAAGTPIAVQGGQVEGGIDFALEEGGSIAGTIRASDTGLPIEGVEVYIFDAGLTDLVDVVQTDAAGHYRSFPGLPTGSYYLRVFATEVGYLDEGYDNVACDGRCSLPGGVTPVPVTLGQVTGGIDFLLDRGATITGRVTDANTGQPIAEAEVAVVSTSRFPYWDSAGITDENGEYRLLWVVGPATYHVHVEPRNGYLGEVWREVDCFVDCWTRAGTPITLGIGETAAGIDFTPARGGSISGRVVDRHTRAPLARVGFRLFAENGLSLNVPTASTDADGRYVIDGIPTGRFFMVALEGEYPDNTYVDQLYGERPCPGLNCDPTTGRPVSVTLGEPTERVDFRLDLGGKIAGRITDAVTGAPLAYSAAVYLYDARTLLPVLEDGDGTDGDGRYVTSEALPRGRYFALAASSSHIAELYDDVPCQTGCNVNLGTPIRVIPGEIAAGIDFALLPTP
jgi:carboxypeptidase family protein